MSYASLRICFPRRVLNLTSTTSHLASHHPPNMRRLFSRPLFRSSFRTHIGIRSGRYSTTPPSPPTPKPSALSKLHYRLPPRLRPYLTPLLNAPVSHATSFLILHELTAILPLAALFSVFHYFLSPSTLSSVQDWPGFSQGIERWGRYARRKGWVTDDQEVVELEEGKVEGNGGGAPRIVVELAAAYAVTKMLLPVRLAASVGMTPWFARAVLLPVLGVVRRLAGRKG